MKDCISVHFIPEFVFFLYKMGESILEPAVKLYLYQGVCIDEFPENLTICESLHKHPKEEDYIQGISALYIMYYKILLNLPAIVLGLFCGAWSDRVGRKLPIMLPCVGSVLASCLYILSGVNKDSLVFVLAGATVNGIFGKSAVIAMAVHSYVSDVSDKETRTRRLGRLLAMNFFGLFAGSLIAGVLLDTVSFDVTFCVVAACNGLVVMLTTICLQESVNEDVLESAVSTSLFHLENLRSSFSVLCKPRKGNIRCHLIIFFLTIIVNQACKAGDVDITLLFVQHRPLSWTKSQYGYLLATNYACLGMCLFVLLPVLSDVFQMKDITLVITGLLFKIIRLIFAAFNTKTWMVYLSIVIGSLSGLTVSGLKSQVSKTVDCDDVGKAFSMLSVGETAANLLGALVFTSLYGATVDIFPGMAYLIEAFVHIILLGLMIWLARDMAVSQHYNLLSNVKYGLRDGIRGPDLGSKATLAPPQFELPLESIAEQSSSSCESENEFEEDDDDKIVLTKPSPEEKDDLKIY